jgi:hypothetical protein
MRRAGQRDAGGCPAATRSPRVPQRGESRKSSPSIMTACWEIISISWATRLTWARGGTVSRLWSLGREAGSCLMRRSFRARRWSEGQGSLCTSKSTASRRRVSPRSGSSVRWGGNGLSPSPGREAPAVRGIVQREQRRAGPVGVGYLAPPHARLGLRSHRRTTDDYADNLGEIAGRLLAGL